jgi:mRNA-degrading endonuclease RelE of RelBE toxin-antitoxin system
MLVTVAETPEFIAAARRLMDDAARATLVDYLAANPEAGDLIPATGGVRKLRWGLERRGKRGGARVIYYYHSAQIPLFIYSIYAKNMQSDLSSADKKELKQISKLIAENYGKAGR